MEYLNDVWRFGLQKYPVRGERQLFPARWLTPRLVAIANSRKRLRQFREDLGNLANEWPKLFSGTFLEAAQPLQREVSALMYLETGDVSGFTIGILQTYLAYIKRGKEAKVLIFCSN